MKISFSEEAFKDYEYWQKQDRKTLKRINIGLSIILFISLLFNLI